MTELVTNKINPNVIPHLHIWGWDVAIYLFLGGIAGGLLIISAAMILLQKGGIFSPEEQTAEYSRQIQVASLLAPVLLGVGMFFLFLDLEFKMHVWRFYTNFNLTSPMSWGSWALLIFFPFSVFQAIVVCQFSQIPRFLFLASWESTLKPYLNKIAAVNVHVGMGIGVYTGILLSTYYARPLWSNTVLGFVFLLSGLSSAAALLLLIAPSREKQLYSKIDMYIIAAEGFATTLFILGGITGTENMKNAMLYLIAGPYAPWFWILFVLAGLIIPLVLETLEAIGKIRFSPFVPLLVLIGSISLRFIIVYAGQEIPTFS
ncbi:MAG: polysulfide reductase NrfD [SAR324 cluster bacterium]|nr:polysulfide reductase NrfD [SAR324 cluster bacterium]